jgi:RNA polymerase sigma factor (sigma-70 family)
MPAGDNTVDNRWRPDSEASQRRVSEEEAEARSESSATRFSRELAFVPNNRRPVLADSNAQTRALERRYRELETLPHGHAVIERLEEWRWPQSGWSAADKQRYLEPLIAQVGRDPQGHGDLLLFLLIVFEPVRRGVSAAFRRARAGLEPKVQDLSFARRGEAKLLAHIERQRLEDVTREGILTAIVNYPTKSPSALFGWLRDTVAHRALDQLRDELPQITDGSLDAPEARTVGCFLDLLPDLDAPPIDPDSPTTRVVVGDMRRLYEVVDEFFDHQPVRDACHKAIDRLPRRQGEVIRALYFNEIDAATIASLRGVTKSTIKNTHAHARKNLHDDDSFFSRLWALGIVRDKARALEIERRFPGGLMPDGRRRIVITEDAA